MKSRIRVLIAGAASACLVLAASALAWACSAQSTLVIAPTLNPAVRESLATGNAGQMAPGTTGLEIRWGALNGPAVASVALNENREFSTNFQVPPQTAPGVYYLVLAAGDQRLAGAAVEVTGRQNGATTGVSSDLWNGFSADNASGMGDAGPASQSTPQSLRALGLAFVATGLAAAAAGGFGAAVIRSRRRANS